MQLKQYYSDDYAGLETGKYHFYYGYEKTIIVENSEDELWCFVVTENSNEIFRKTSEDIQNASNRNWQLNDVRDYLIAGIGMWLLLK